MSTKTLQTRVKNKRDTSANWTQNNPVILNGEIILVDTDNGLRAKVGDGSKTYTQLPFSDEALRSLINGKADTGHTHSDATGSASGLMSATDKTKLDGIATGAEVNVQSDWNQSNDSADDFIKNKPTKLSKFTDDLGTNPDHSHSQYLTAHQSLAAYRTYSDQDTIDAALDAKLTSKTATASDIGKFAKVKAVDTATGTVSEWEFGFGGSGGGGGIWGSIEGTLSNQGDLQDALDNKQNTITQSTSAPANPSVGDYWDDTNNVVYYSTTDQTAVVVDQAIVDGSVNPVAGNAVHDALVTLDAKLTSKSATASDVGKFAKVKTVDANTGTVSEWEFGIGGSSSDFEALDNRPLYNGNVMSHSTDIPEVKTATWDAKYDKPSGGIPKTDLANAVQTSLGKADTALQEHQSLSAYRTASAQDQIDAGQTSAISQHTSQITATQGMISDAWNGSTTYTIGQYCIYNNALYRCKVQHQNQRPPNTTYWEAVSVCDELDTYGKGQYQLNGIYSGHASGSGNYATFFVPLNISKSVTDYSITFSNPTIYIYLAGSRLTQTDLDTSYFVIAKCTGGITIELKFASTQTQDIMAVLRAPFGVYLNLN